MKDFIKKTAEDAADVGGQAIKAALKVFISELTKELVEETGVKDLAKDKVLELGVKAAKDMGINPKDLQKNLIKEAIKKELQKGNY